jgi:hypothetical protein
VTKSSLTSYELACLRDKAINSMVTGEEARHLALWIGELMTAHAEALATIARVDALHQPRQALEILRCHAHRGTSTREDCPDCTTRPITVCSNITCCGWPCAAHLAIHPEEP